MLCNKFVYTDAVFLNLSLLDVYLPVPGARTLILYDLVVGAGLKIGLRCLSERRCLLQLLPDGTLDDN